MKKNHMLIFAIIISSLMFSACTMSASTPPPVTPTTNLSEIARQATETAIAKTPKTGETQDTEATADPAATVAEADIPTSTPEAVETEEPEVVTEYAVPDTYTLHEGEFVFCLARRFNLLPEDIMTYNGIASGTIFYPGETITLPASARAFIGDRALQYHPSTYAVIYGDTLYSIACLYGDVDPRAIAAANDIDINQALTPGTVLQIP
jgi:LysM repeat protein